MVLNTVARDEWPDEIQTLFRKDYASDLAGPIIKRRVYRGPGYVDLTDSLKTLAQLGGNFDGHFYHFDRHPLAFRQVTEGRTLLGAGINAGSVMLRVPFYRARGLAVVERLPKGDPGVISADFKMIVHGGTPENVLWSGRVDVPPDQQSAALPFEVDTLGQLVEIWVLPHAAGGSRLFAGFREIELTNSIETADDVPQLRPHHLPDTAVTPALAENLFGGIGWRPRQWIVRGGSKGEQGLQFAPGGEMWMRTAGMTGEIRGRIYCAASPERLPMVQVVWYKGGRLQLLQHGRVAPGEPFDFHVWTAEPGGWIGILVDDEERVSPVQVRVESSTLIP